MKFVIATFAIAALAQLAMAGPLVRQKRSEDFIKHFEETYQTAKTFSPRGETLASNMLKDIPRTDGYSEYIKLLDLYISAAQSFKSLPDMCYQKSMQEISLITDLLFGIKSISFVHESPEADEVARLLAVHGGNTLDADLTNFHTKLTQFNLKTGSHSLTESETSRIKSLAAEVC